MQFESPDTTALMFDEAPAGLGIKTNEGVPEQAGTVVVDVAVEVDVEVLVVELDAVVEEEVVVLVDIGEFSYADAAGILGVPIGTVMSRLFRARRVLEKELADVAARDYGFKRAA